MKQGYFFDEPVATIGRVPAVNARYCPDFIDWGLFVKGVEVDELGDPILGSKESFLLDAEDFAWI